MSCEKQNAVLDFHEGELAPDEAARVREHLQSCPACRALLADLRRTAAALRGLEPERSQLRPDVIRQRVARRATRPARGLAAAVLATIAVGAALLVSDRGPVGGRSGDGFAASRGAASRGAAASRHRAVWPPPALDRCARAGWESATCLALLPCGTADGCDAGDSTPGRRSGP